MTKKICGFIGAVMLAFASAFLAYALNHPEASFSISLGALYSIYGIYAVVMIALLIIGVRKEKEKTKGSN